MRIEENNRPPFVRFERRPKESKLASLEAGRSVSVDVDYAYITQPGSMDVVSRKADAWLLSTEKKVKHGRVPAEWLEFWKKKYAAFKNDQELPTEGTPIKGWSQISPATQNNLLSINVYTVEDLANLNADGIQKYGMGGNQIKKMAQNWLQAAKDHGPLTMKVTQLEAENEGLHAIVRSLEEKVNLLSAQIETNQHAPVVRRDTEITASDIMDEPVQRTDTLTHNNVPAQIASEPSLAEQYIVKFGKKPHWKMKDETIRQKLEA